MIEREVVLCHDGTQWRARGEGVDVARHELRDLDALLERTFADRRARVRVRVRFDASTLPRWLRQYHAHYCNYDLLIAPQETGP